MLTDARLLAIMTSPSDDVTALLDAWSRGDAGALAELMEVAQKELRQMARRAFRGERQGHTLQPTALVNEVFLKLKGQRQVHWRGRAEFFGVAAKLMRRILVDHARRSGARKRGGDTVRVTLDESAGFPEDLAPEILALDDALLDLARRSPRQSRIVEMRVIVGLTLEEVAAVEKISPSSAFREWKAARLFLLRELERYEAGTD
jgi:RNA polymerase sigma factor (TIGR02999 family)